MARVERCHLQHALFNFVTRAVVLRPRMTAQVSKRLAQCATCGVAHAGECASSRVRGSVHSQVLQGLGTPWQQYTLLHPA